MRYLTACWTTLTLGAAATFGAQVQLLPPQEHDLAATSLSAATAKATLAHLDRTPVAVSWTLDPTQAVSTAKTQRQESREYFVEATAAELAAGFAVYTTAPGALVRINPVDPAEKAAAVAISAVRVVRPDGHELGANEAFSLSVGDAELKAAGAGFAEGTVAVRLADQVGAGQIVIKAALAKAATRGYVLHILDANSDISLGAATRDLDVLAGGTLRVRARVEKAGTPVSAELVGFVTSPDGAIFDLRFVNHDGLSVARLPLADCASDRQGLWEAHLSSRSEVDGKVALRSVRTAFGCAEATARFNGHAELLDGVETGAIATRLGVETAVAGRYEVRGTIFGTDADGNLQPTAMAHSAAWLEAGSGHITLQVDAATLEANKLGAPFEVRDLTLIDQGHMGVLHRQARGLLISP